MHPIQMSSGGGELAFFLFLLFVPAINRDLASGLERFLLQFRESTDDILGVDEAQLTFGTEAELCFEKGIAPLCL